MQVALDSEAGSGADGTAAAAVVLNLNEIKGNTNYLLIIIMNVSVGPNLPEVPLSQEEDHEVEV